MKCIYTNGAKLKEYLLVPTNPIIRDDSPNIPETTSVVSTTITPVPNSYPDGFRHGSVSTPVESNQDRS